MPSPPNNACLHTCPLQSLHSHARTRVSKQEALQELSAAEAQAGRRVAELEEVTLAEGKKYGSVAEEVDAKRRKLERLEKRLAELQADIQDAYRDFQQVPGYCCSQPDG